MTSAQGALLIVPDSYPSVQAALLATQPGDTVLVRPGIYYESLLVPPRELTLAGEFILDADTSRVDSTILHAPLTGYSRNLIVESVGPTIRLTVVGLTICGGSFRSEVRSGGIELSNCELRMEYCRLDSCDWWFGAVTAVGSWVEISHCRLTHFAAASSGNLLNTVLTDVTIVNSEIAQNHDEQEGFDSVIRIKSGSLVMHDCLVRDIGQTYWLGHHFVRPDSSPNDISISRCNFTGSRFYDFFDSAEDSVNIRFDSNLVRFCQIKNSIFDFTLAAARSEALFRDNVFQENEGIQGQGDRMFFILGGDLPQTIKVSRNVFLNNSNGEFSGLAITRATVPDVSVNNNYFIGNSSNGYMVPPGGVCYLVGWHPATFRRNVLINNYGYAAFHGPHNFPLGDARECYWGHETGPFDTLNNPDGLGDTVDSQILYYPWLTDTTELESAPSRNVAAPLDFLIGYVYPNPFNSATSIEYVLTRPQFIELEIFDLTGRAVGKLHEGLRNTGVHQATWNGFGRASGLYFARLSSTESSQLPVWAKLVLIR